MWTISIAPVGMEPTVVATVNTYRQMSQRYISILRMHMEITIKQCGYEGSLIGTAIRNDYDIKACKIMELVTTSPYTPFVTPNFHGLRIEAREV